VVKKMIGYEWLKTLKEGDSLFIEYGGFGSNRISPVTVKRITPTMIIISTGDRFRHNGNEIGGGKWDHGKWLRQDNDEMKEAYWMQNARNELKDIVLAFDTRINFQSLTHEQLERIIPELTKIRDELIPQKKVE
jgi:hypothetical protein